MVQKIYFKMYHTSSANTPHESIFFKVDGISYNIQNWISHEQNVNCSQKNLQCASKTEFSENIFFSRGDLQLRNYVSKVMMPFQIIKIHELYIVWHFWKWNSACSKNGLFPFINEKNLLKVFKCSSSVL